MLKRLIIWLLVFTAYTATSISNDKPSVVRTGSKTKISSLQKKIDALLANPLFASASIGIRIVSLQTGKSLYSLNQNKLLHPASNQKIIITSSALHLLRPDFRFRTDFETDGTIDQNVLKGNLIIRGSGDPMISTADFDSVAATLRNLGIQKVRGNIIGDVSYFDSLLWGKGWMWDDEPYPDAPFISPLSVNKNAITFLLSPGIHERDTIQWKQDPKTEFISVCNEGYTSYDTSMPFVAITRPPRINTATIKGVMAPTDTGKDVSISVWQPDKYFLYHLRERLELAGIRCEGSMLIENKSPSAILTSVYHPLDSVLHRINKQSDNLAAENLLKTIGAECTKNPGTAADGLARIKDHLHTYIIDTSRISLADGSGASWYNSVSPSTITEILLTEYKNKETFHRFYESLSIAGTDGTLKNRMLKTHLRDKVYAKTGSLTGVNCISGYVTNKRGFKAAFSIMVNHFTCKNGDVRQLQDDIIEAIATASFK